MHLCFFQYHFNFHKEIKNIYIMLNIIHDTFSLYHMNEIKLIRQTSPNIDEPSEKYSF